MPSFTAADGRSVHYENRGSPDGPPLVLLCGGPGRHPDYLRSLDVLTRHRRLIVPHPRGVGDSIDVPAVSFVDAAADLESLRRHLGVERLDAVAHSTGSRAALIWAAEHPDRVGRLLLVSPGTAWLGLAPEASLPLPALREGEVEYPTIDAAIAAAVRLRTQAERDALQNRLRRAAWAVWDTEAERWENATVWESAAAAAFFGPVDTAAVRAGLARVSAPVIVLMGEKDRLVPLAGAAALVDLIPGAELAVVEDCGHYPWIESPAEFAMALRAALSETPIEPPLGRRRRTERSSG